MAAIRGHFDNESYYRALDNIRGEQSLTWKQVSEATKVSASTLTRLAQGKNPDADGLAMLAAWSGLNPADFVMDKDIRPSQLGGLNQILTYLRADPTLSKESVAALDHIITTAYKQFEKISSDHQATKRVQKRS
jgi:transcriptional regulator with XRE-family HTH domain